jgi:Protein of unknown function (DUF3352)
MLKKNKRFLWFCLGSSTILIGGIGLYLFFQLQNSKNFPLGANLIPDDTLFALSLTTDDGQWSRLQQYGTKETQTVFKKQLSQLQNNFLKVNGYDYQQDIKPWIGKQIMIGFLSAQVQSEKQSNSLIKDAWVIVVPINNPLEAQKQLESAKSSKISRFVERNYQGFTIRDGLNNNAQNFTISTTVLGRSLIITTDSKATEKVIDSYKSGKSLATTSGYIQALGNISNNNNFAQVYFNSSVATQVFAANSAKNINGDQVKQIPETQGVITKINLENDGIRFRGVSWLNPNSKKILTVENNSTIIPNLLPENTVMMVSGGNLTKLWLDYTKNAQFNPLVPINPEGLKTGTKSLFNVDLEQDLLPWMDGEFAFALVNNEQKSANLGASLLFMVQAKDNQKAQTVFKQIDEYMKEHHKLQVEKTQLKGKEIVNWKSPLLGFNATHGQLDNNIMFLALGDAIAENIVPKPKSNLGANSLFKLTTNSNINPNNGYFFIDLEKTLQPKNLLFSQLIPPDFKPLFSGIKAIGITTGIKDQRSSVFDLFVVIKQEKNK